MIKQMGRLFLRRACGEFVQIGDVKIVVCALNRTSVSLMIEAPREVEISHREEHEDQNRPTCSE